MAESDLMESSKTNIILIVDDEPSIRMTIEEMLRILKCKIFHASNGKEALDILKTVDVDLIILDLLLPGRHGFNVCSDIRDMDKGKNIPILMITAIYTKMKYFHQAREYGANAYLTKPFKMETLIKEVSRLLKIGDLEHKTLAASVEK